MARWRRWQAGWSPAVAAAVAATAVASAAILLAGRSTAVAVLLTADADSAAPLVAATDDWTGGIFRAGPPAPPPRPRPVVRWAASPQLTRPLLDGVHVSVAAASADEGLLSTSRVLDDWALGGSYRYARIGYYTSRAAYRRCPYTLTIGPYDAAAYPRDAQGSLRLPPSVLTWNSSRCVAVGPGSPAHADVPGSDLIVISSELLFSDAGQEAYPRVVEAMQQTGADRLGGALHALGVRFSVVYAPSALACVSDDKTRAGGFLDGTILHVVRRENSSVVFSTVSVPPKYRTAFLYMPDSAARVTASLCALSTARLTGNGSLLEADAPPPGPTETPTPTPTRAPMDAPVAPETVSSGGAGGDGGSNGGEGGDEEGLIDAERACFPSSSLVTLASGRVVSMRSLRLGDEVVIGGGRLSTVYAFSHADGREAVRHPFVRLATTTGVTLTASPGHYVYVLDGADRRLVLAAAVRVGDVLPLATGTNHSTVVVGVSRVALPGLYNPHTLDGDIAVDGVVVSTWTVAVPPAVAAAALAPLQWLVRRTAGGRAAGIWLCVSRAVGAMVNAWTTRTLMMAVGREE
ncbi:hypothetical protein MMPV_001985 [Pyropia vietnamensis]